MARNPVAHPYLKGLPWLWQLKAIQKGGHWSDRPEPGGYDRAGKAAREHEEEANWLRSLNPNSIQPEMGIHDLQDLRAMLVVALERDPPHSEGIIKRISGGLSRIDSILADPPLSLIIIGCVKCKQDRPAPAAEMYTSDLWKKRRAYAEAAGVPWLIVSAKYGILRPDEVIEPYDKALTDLTPEERKEWDKVLFKTWQQKGKPILLGQKGKNRIPVLEIHAGAPYVEALKTLPTIRSGNIIRTPMEGLGIGEQLGWYKRQAKAEERPMGMFEQIRDKLIASGKLSASMTPEQLEAYRPEIEKAMGAFLEKRPAPTSPAPRPTYSEPVSHSSLVLEQRQTGRWGFSGDVPPQLGAASSWDSVGKALAAARALGLEPKMDAKVQDAIDREAEEAYQAEKKAKRTGKPPKEKKAPAPEWTKQAAKFIKVIENPTKIGQKARRALKHHLEELSNKIIRDMAASDRDDAFLLLRKAHHTLSSSPRRGGEDVNSLIRELEKANDRIQNIGQHIEALKKARASWDEYYTTAFKRADFLGATVEDDPFVAVMPDENKLRVRLVYVMPSAAAEQVKAWKDSATRGNRFDVFTAYAWKYRNEIAKAIEGDRAARAETPAPRLALPGPAPRLAQDDEARRARLAYGAEIIRRREEAERAQMARLGITGPPKLGIDFGARVEPGRVRYDPQEVERIATEAREDRERAAAWAAESARRMMTWAPSDLPAVIPSAALGVRPEDVLERHWVAFGDAHPEVLRKLLGLGRGKAPANAAGIIFGQGGDAELLIAARLTKAQAKDAQRAGAKVIADKEAKADSMLAALIAEKFHIYALPHTREQMRRLAPLLLDPQRWDELRPAKVERKPRKGKARVPKAPKPAPDETWRSATTRTPDHDQGAKAARTRAEQTIKRAERALTVAKTPEKAAALQAQIAQAQATIAAYLRYADPNQTPIDHAAFEAWRRTMQPVGRLPTYSPRLPGGARPKIPRLADDCRTLEMLQADIGCRGAGPSIPSTMAPASAPPPAYPITVCPTKNPCPSDFPPSWASGCDGLIYDSEGRSYGYTRDVVPLSDLITSHDDAAREDPRFPQRFQARDRSATESQLDIMKMARTLDPERLAQLGPTPTEGAPVVWDGDGQRNIVLAGNGRTMALRQAPPELQACYLDLIESLTGHRGVLVRRLKASPAEALAFAAASQRSGAAPETPMEQARALVRSLGGLTYATLPRTNTEPLKGAPLSDLNVVRFEDWNRGLKQTVYPTGAPADNRARADRYTLVFLALLPDAVKTAIASVGREAEDLFAGMAPYLAELQGMRQRGELAGLDFLDPLPRIARAAPLLASYAGMSSRAILNDLAIKAVNPPLPGFTDPLAGLEVPDIAWTLGLVRAAGRANPYEVGADLGRKLVDHALEEVQAAGSSMFGYEPDPMKQPRTIFASRKGADAQAVKDAEKFEEILERLSFGGRKNPGKPLPDWMAAIFKETNRIDAQNIALAESLERDRIGAAELRGDPHRQQVITSFYLAPSVRPEAAPGSWQMTRMAADGPMGHRFYPSIRDALVKEGRDYGAFSVVATAPRQNQRRNPFRTIEEFAAEVQGMSPDELAEAAAFWEREKAWALEESNEPRAWDAELRLRALYESPSYPQEQNPRRAYANPILMMGNPSRALSTKLYNQLREARREAANVTGRDLRERIVQATRRGDDALDTGDIDKIRIGLAELRQARAMQDADPFSSGQPSPVFEQAEAALWDVREALKVDRSRGEARQEAAAQLGFFQEAAPVQAQGSFFGEPAAQGGLFQNPKGIPQGAVPIDALPAAVKNSDAFREALKATRARYGEPTHAIPVTIPPGASKVLAPIGQMDRFGYFAADRFGAPVTRWYHVPGDKGEGKSKGKPQFLGWDSVHGYPVIAYPEGSTMDFTPRGIVG